MSNTPQNFLTNEYPTEAQISAQNQAQTPTVIPIQIQYNIHPQTSEPFIDPQSQMLPSNVQNFQKQKQIITASLRSVPVMVTCPSCGYSGLTRTQTSFNIANCACCWLTDPICWCCFQLCRGKDLSCNDANHFCAKCNSVLGSYTAC